MQRIDRYGLVALVLIISSAAGAVAYGSGLSVNSAVAYVTGTRSPKSAGEADGEQVVKKKDAVAGPRGGAPQSGAERSGTQSRGATQGSPRVRPRDDGNLALAEGPSRGDRGSQARRSGTQEQTQRQRQFEQDRKRREAAALAEAERIAEQQRLADLRAQDERRPESLTADRGRGSESRGEREGTRTHRPVDRDIENGARTAQGAERRSGRRTHVVQSGETMSSIAKNRLGAERRYLEIQKLNPNVDPRRMGAGTRLVLPSIEGGEAPSVAQGESSHRDSGREERSTPRGGSGRTYTVRPGDTLSQIAQREVGSVRYLDAIRDLNPELRDRALHVGAVIQLPSSGGTQPGPSAPQTRSYRVASGDSLIRIARKELGDGDLYTLIQELNPGVNPAALVIGSTLELPTRGSSLLARADVSAGRR